MKWSRQAPSERERDKGGVRGRAQGWTVYLGDDIWPSPAEELWEGRQANVWDSWAAATQMGPTLEPRSQWRWTDARSKSSVRLLLHRVAFVYLHSVTIRHHTEFRNSKEKEYLRGIQKEVLNCNCCSYSDSSCSCSYYYWARYSSTLPVFVIFQ